MKDFIKALCKKFGITKETARRAVRTFCQAAIGYISVNLIMVDFDCGQLFISFEELPIIC